ncbi:PAS domain S-box protein [Desulfopila sp. IMCC35008]|uniref:PAS domain S-box protein n=1 Tax=Desulfopila sp. IMCC35008 TaxID=2653858 RepID=UPI0013D73BBF|nr:PAS domain S-box protein [Desulfopila sp. IMCC35008]
MISQQSVISKRRLMVCIQFVIVFFVCSSASGYGEGELSAEAVAWLKENNHKIRLAPVPEYAPIDFRDDDGEFIGLSQDYIRAIEEMYDFRFKRVAVKNFSDLIEKLKNREVDLTSSIGINDKRKEFLHFHKPHVRVKKVIITRQSVLGTITWEDLTGRKVALVDGYIVSNLIKEKYPDINFHMVSSEKNGLKHVSLGESYALIIDLGSASYNLKQMGITNLRVAGETEFSFDLRIASRNDWPYLTEIIQKGLENISPEQRENIYNKWVSFTVPPYYLSKQFWIILFSLILVISLIIFLGWYLRNRLRKEVLRRTKELRSSEAKFRALFDQAADNILLLKPKSDGSLIIMDINPAGAELHGYTRGELYGKNIIVLDKHVSTEQIEKIVSALNRDELVRFEVVHQKKDGGEITLEVSAKRIFIDDEVYYLSVERDIGDRIEHQKAIEARDRVFRHAMDLLCVANSEGYLTEINPAWEKTLGWDEEELKAKPFMEFIHPDDRDSTSLAASKLAKGETAIGFENRYLTKDGEYRVLSWNTYPYAKDGTIFGTARDVTERRQLEKEYRNLFNQMLDGFANHKIILDEHGKPVDYVFLSINPAFTEMTGLSEEELIGKTVLEVMPNTEQYWLDKYGKVAITGEPIRFEQFSNELDKHFEVLAFQSKQNHFATIFRDITERKLLADQALQSQKMEAMGTLAGGIAHDFNNLLAVILGYTDLTLDDDSCSKEVKKNLHQVTVAANRAKQLVQQILSFSRKSTEEKQIVRIQAEVDEMLKLLKNTLPVTIKISINYCEEDLFVYANSTHLHQILMNICTNAYYAMRDEGGTLSINVEAINVDSKLTSKIIDLREGRYGRIIIRDTGKGIPSIIINRIFEPFFTTKGTGEGTGMGLAMVHGIVKDHRGAIDVESTVGKGTAFSIYLPLADGTDNEDSVSTHDEFQYGNGHILIVDDEPMIAELMARTLEVSGYSVTTVLNAKDALKEFQKNPMSFDLVITDQTMPGMTGGLLTKELLVIRSDIPVVICTGYSDILDRTKALKYGAKELLMKPVDRTQLSMVVGQILSDK